MGFRRNPAEIVDIRAQPFNAPLREPFTIASGSKSEARNVLVRIKLRSGVLGYGEGAGSAATGRADQDLDLLRARAAGEVLLGKDARSWRRLLEAIEEEVDPRWGFLRAALGMAVLDAFARQSRMPLRLLFGGAERLVRSDVTVTIVPPSKAALDARRIAAMGVKTIKIKVGTDLEDDLGRVVSVRAAAPRAKLFLDANQGYSPPQAIALVRRLRSRGIEPMVFEQPVEKDDFSGLAAVARLARIPVVADESVQTPGDVPRLARLKAAQIVNIKLMKRGLLAAYDAAICARGLGLGLMMGGMVESCLAMGCAAHFAAGLGGFQIVDLDTPLWFRTSPTEGLSLGPGGVYDLSKVTAGIGVVPRATAT